MELFKTITCAHCGAKTGAITRTKIANGDYLCASCVSVLPNYITESLCEYDLDDYIELRKYIAKSDAVLKKQFQETHSYYDIHLDAHNGLFYIDESPRIYLPLTWLKSFDLSFDPEIHKEGWLGEKVVGKVYVTIESAFPKFYISRVLATNVKAEASTKGVFQKHVQYGEPPKMKDFYHFFVQAQNRALDKHISEMEALDLG